MWRAITNISKLPEYKATYTQNELLAVDALQTLSNYPSRIEEIVDKMITQHLVKHWQIPINTKETLLRQNDTISLHVLYSGVSKRFIYAFDKWDQKVALLLAIIQLQNAAIQYFSYSCH